MNKTHQQRPEGHVPPEKKRKPSDSTSKLKDEDDEVDSGTVRHKGDEEQDEPEEDKIP